MSEPTLRNLLKSGRELRDLARAMGEICLISLTELSSLKAAPHLAQLTAGLQTALKQVEVEWWLDPQRSVNGYIDLLDQPDVAQTADALAGIAPPLAALAALRAICARPLTHYYARTWESFELRRGDPIPLPSRPTQKAFLKVTPAPKTMQRRSILAGTNFRIYGGPTNTPLTATLDFADRDNLDAATWMRDKDGERLPRVVSIHPYGDADDLGIEEISRTTFFWVKPRRWRAGQVLGQLSQTKAAIAVMPELSLPEPDALGEALAEAHEAFPDLVVAGSAHAELPDDSDSGRMVRVNRTIAYLHGAPLLHHDKIHEFVTKYVGPGHGNHERREDLTPRSRVTVAAGTVTRLAVVICADLNDSEIPLLLEQLGVNLLLAPALTERAGAFASACASLARNQAFSVIVNGTPLQHPESSSSPGRSLRSGPGGDRTGTWE